MSFWYFLSYARADLDGYLKRFKADLRAELGKIRSAQSLSVSSLDFCDLDNTQAGELWEPHLANALANSRFLVSLCSPNYYISEYCGKEFAVFLDRHTQHVERVPEQTPTVILPILWGEPTGSLHEIVQRFQYFDSDFPPVYAKEGLLYMMRLVGHRDEYLKFIRAVARKLVQAGERHLLAFPYPIRPLAEVSSAFHSPLCRSSVRRSPSSFRMESRFVFVAARNHELDPETAPIERYGEKSGYWAPYFPAEQDGVGILALGIVSTLKFHYEELPLGSQLVARLREARDQHQVVAILVDPWTLQLPSYRDVMLSYDEWSSLNCALVVVWHEDDYNNPERRAELRTAIEEAFPSKIQSNLPIYYFRDSVLSSQDLRTHLIESLTAVRMKWLGKLMAEGTPHKAEDAAIIKQAEEKGITIGDVKPEVASPGGTGR